MHFTFGGEVVAGLCYFIWEGERLAELREDRLLLDEVLEVHADDGDHGGTSVLELLKTKSHKRKIESRRTADMKKKPIVTAVKSSSMKICTGQY